MTIEDEVRAELAAKAGPKPGEPRYSLSEIDRMRRALLTLVWQEVAYRREGQHEIVAEDRLRTHMLNGTPPDELERAASEMKVRQEREFMRAVDPNWVDA